MSNIGEWYRDIRAKTNAILRLKPRRASEGVTEILAVNVGRDNLSYACDNGVIVTPATLLGM